MSPARIILAPGIPVHEVGYIAKLHIDIEILVHLIDIDKVEFQQSVIGRRVRPFKMIACAVPGVCGIRSLTMEGEFVPPHQATRKVWSSFFQKAYVPKLKADAPCSGQESFWSR